MESPKNKDRKQAQKAKRFILPQNQSACQIFPSGFPADRAQALYLHENESDFRLVDPDTR
jgi:hypothetical protein